MTDHLDEGIDKHAFVRIWVESHIIAQYQECKIGHDVKMIADLDIVSSGYVEKDIETGKIYGEGINYARRLADTPSHLMTPEDMVKAADEKGWRLPMDDEYFAKIKSNSADFKNSMGKPGAGASIAANFLNAFVEEGTKWIHLDIAGTADNDGTGATGAMIRSVVNMFSK